MKTEENLARTAFGRQVYGQHGILLASEVVQSRTYSSMPAKSQPVGISVSVLHDPNTNDVFSNWIRSAEGFSVVSRHTAVSSALAALPNEKPSIVLLEIDSPDLSAFDCLRQLKPVLQQTQFVALSADEDVGQIFNALATGATGYVLKHASRNELLAELKLIHAGGSPMNSSLAIKVLQSIRNQSPIDSTAELSPRETRILRLLANGSSHREAAAGLNISLPILSTCFRSIYEKLHLQTAAKIPSITNSP
jgi:DNA-binding NarL/FixJ family response regulator